MRKIELSKGKHTIVDDGLYEELSSYSWHCTYYGYAARKSRKTEEDHGASYIMLMHRFIMNAPAGMDVDHINGDRLDNRMSNLRLCTRGENIKNRIKKKNSTSRFIGVAWDKKRNVWASHICSNYKRMFIGHFDNEYDAALAYNEKAKEFHGDYAKLNDVKQENGLK